MHRQKFVLLGILLLMALPFGLLGQSNDHYSVDMEVIMGGAQNMSGILSTGENTVEGTVSLIINQPAVTPEPMSGSVHKVDLGFWSQLLRVPATPKVSATYDIYPDRIVLDWRYDPNDPPGTKRSRIYRDYGSNTTPIVEVPAGIRTYTDNDLPAGGQYEYRVQASNQIQSANTYQPLADAGVVFGKTSSSGTIAGFIKTSLQSPVPNVRVTAYNQTGTGPAWGKSLFLDGSDTVTISDADIFEFLDQSSHPEMTLEFWFKPEVNGQQTLLSKGTEWELGMDNDGFNYIYFNINDAPIAVSDNLEDQAIAVGEWNHVALVREGQNLRMHINGWLATVNGGDDAVNIGASTSGPGDLLIGDGPDHFYFRGGVDELRFWSETRDAMFMEPYSDVNNSGTYEDSTDFYTDINGDGQWGPSDSTEITRDYNRLFDRISAGEVVEPSLIACFHMDMGIGTAIVNSADVSHSGTIEGAVWSDVQAPTYPSAFTDGDGAYNITNLNFGNGRTFRIIPRKAYHEFDNPYLPVSLNQFTPSQNSINFRVTNMITISGYVKHSTIATAGANCGEADVEIWVDGAFKNNRTDEDGYYLIEVEPGRTVTLSPKKGGRSGFNFFPLSKTFFNVITPQSQSFVDDFTRTLRGSVTGGACEYPLGPSRIATVTLNADNGCFSREETVDAAGNFEFENVAPMAYTLSVAMNTDIPGIPGLLDIETYFQNNGATIDIEDAYDRLDSVWTTEEDTVSFNYRSAMVMDTEGWSINELGDRWFAQNGADTLDIYVFEEYYGGRCPVDTGIIYIKDWISDRYVDGDDVAGVSIPFSQDKDDLDAPSYRYGLLPGLPRLEGDHKKSFEIRASDPEGQIETDSRNYRAVVLGQRPNQLNFATTAPEIPLMILRRPPGDNSFASFSESNSSSTSFSMSMGSANSSEESIEVNLGVETEVNIAPFGVGTSFNIEAEASLESGFTVTNALQSSTEMQMTLTTSAAYMTATADELMGDRGTVFVGGAMNLLYGATNVLDYIQDNGNFRYSLTQEVIFMPDGFETTYIYTRGYVENYLLPELTYLAQTDSNLIRSVERWNYILDYEDSLKWAAPVEDNFSFSGGGQSMTRTHIQESTEALVFEETLDLDESFAASMGIKIAGFGVGGTVKASTSLSLGSSRTSSSTNTTETSYTLVDDDDGDDYTVDVGTDPVYGTPVFRVVAGNSSCPYEEWTNQAGEVTTTPRDIPGMNWLSPSTIVNVHPEGTAELTIGLSNESSLMESRVYYLSFLSASNPGGAQILINGQLADESASIPFDLEYLGSDSALITVTRPDGSDVYDFENLLIKFAPECETNYAGITQGFTTSFNVHFARPCTEAEIYQPQENWIVNTVTGDTMTLVVQGYDLGQSYFDELLVQYSAVGDANWYAVDTLFADTLRIDNQLYSQLFWDVGDLIDAEYDVRLQSRCLDGALNNIMDAVRGVIDRQIPEVLGVPEPVDGVLNFDDAIALNFTEPINPETVTPVNVTLEDLSNSEMISDFQLSVSANRLIITPTLQNRFIENHSLRARIQGFEDLYGNMGDTLTWTYTVDRNPVAWSTSELSHIAFQGEPDPIVLQLNNTGSMAQSFRFSATPTQNVTPLPEWLTIYPAEGSLNPGGSFDIQMDIDPQLNNGEYALTIYAVTPQGYEPFYLNVVSMCPYPDWSFDFNAYEYSMGVTARLMIMNTPSTDTYDRIGAFVDDECRGWAQLEYVPALDSYQAFISVFSNEWSGEEVEFHLWDRTGCAEYWQADTSVTFIQDANYGTPQDPLVLNASGTLGQTLALNSGFTWISLNLDTEDMSVSSIMENVSAVAGDRIIGHESFAQYSDSDGWVGTLTELDHRSMYQLDLENADELIHVGYPIFADTANIPLESGWNWISYLPRENMNVNHALMSLGSTTDDVIKSQSQYAQFVDGIGWLGSLHRMYPGLGYKLETQSADILNYPLDEETSTMARSSLREELPASPWSFEADGKFQNNMIVTALLESDTLGVNNPADAVAAFIGEELRGIARPVYIPALDAYRVFLMIQGEPGEEIGLKIWDADNDIVYHANQILRFQADAIHGTPLDPYLLTKAPLGIGDKGYVPDVYSLAQNYPNPFNPRTMLGFGLPEDGHVSIRIYNMLGQEIRTLVDEDLTAGYRHIIWNSQDDAGRQVPSGIYLTVMESGSFREVRKMVMLK